jgi:hypothetical protein
LVKKLATRASTMSVEPPQRRRARSRSEPGWECAEWGGRGREGEQERGMHPDEVVEGDAGSMGDESRVTQAAVAVEGLPGKFGPRPRAASRTPLRLEFTISGTTP